MASAYTTTGKKQRMDCTNIVVNQIKKIDPIKIKKGITNFWCKIIF